MSKLIIFDTETTGLENKDRIIQIGAIIVDMKDPEYSKVYNELCSSDVPIEIEAMATHGIRQKQIKDKEPFSKTEFIKELNQLNSDKNYLIAHNLDFDLSMLENEGFVSRLKSIDTLQCAKHLFEIGDEINGYKVSNYKLQTFRYMMFSQEEEDAEAKRYGVKNKAHDAIGDVVILKLFLKKLFTQTTKKIKSIVENAEKFQVFDELKGFPALLSKEIEELENSETMQGKADAIMNIMNLLTQIPTEIKVINFGKYKGKTLEEIEKNNQGYIDNYLYKEEKKKKDNNDRNFDKNMFYTLELARRNRNKILNIV